VIARDAADPFDPDQRLRRGHVADRQDSVGSGTSDAKAIHTGQLVELDPAARRHRAALVMLVIGVHLMVAMPAYGQPGFDSAGIQACTSAATLISDLRSRTLSTAQARQRLTWIYSMAQTSRVPALRQIASMQTGQVASADDSESLTMVEQFRAMACP